MPFKVCLPVSSQFKGAHCPLPRSCTCCQKHPEALPWGSSHSARLVTHKPAHGSTRVLSFTVSWGLNSGSQRQAGKHVVFLIYTPAGQLKGKMVHGRVKHWIESKAINVLYISYLLHKPLQKLTGTRATGCGSARAILTRGVGGRSEVLEPLQDQPGPQSKPAPK